MLWKSENETQPEIVLCSHCFFFFGFSFLTLGLAPNLGLYPYHPKHPRFAQTRGDFFSVQTLTLWRCALRFCLASHKKTLQIAVEWLHQGCDGDLAADVFSSFLHFGAGAFPCKIHFKKCSKTVLFALAPRSSFGAAIPAAIMYLKASLCKSFSVQKDPCVEASLVKVCPCTASLWKEVKRWEELTRGEKSWDELSRGERAEKTEKS